MGYLIDILIGAASRMVTSELSAHVEPMARWIIGKAVQRFPADDRNRFREEWLAHLDETPGTLWKLWHAVGCYLGAAKVAGVLVQQAPAKEAARKEDIIVSTKEGRAVLSADEQVLGSVKIVSKVVSTPRPFSAPTNLTATLDPD